MAASKLAISVFGVILIDGETITEVVRLQETDAVWVTQISDVMETYRTWGPVDYEHLYVSPGLIDCNVRSNSAWESRLEVSEAAVTGGVTMALFEPSLYGQQETAEPTCCDVGAVHTIQSLKDFEVDDSVFAYKIYRYPPSFCIQGYSDSLEMLFTLVAESHLPLFVDSSLPEARMLIMGSPYRHCSLDERVTAKPINEETFNPGAYQNEGKVGHSSSDSDEEEWVFKKPDRTQSSVEGFRQHNIDEGEKPQMDVDPIREEEEETRKKKPASKELEPFSPKPITVFPTLIDDLANRIRYHGVSVQSLNQAELLGYADAGQYVYSAGLPPEGPQANLHFSQRSLSVAPTKPNFLPDLTDQEPKQAIAEMAKTVSFAERVKARRPPTLAMKIAPKLVESSKEREYVIHLANIPDHWEVNGLAKVFKALWRAPCKVHFVNMSSATAANEVRAFRERSDLEVTVETCPHYLFFSMEEVEAGNTRLKAFPPIRNKTNCNLLWELLKVKCIDVISSQHAALGSDLKFLESGSFKRALSGINSLGISLQAVWTKLRMPSVDSEAVRERYIVRLSKWMSQNPAKLLGLSQKRGSIESGKLADFVVWAPHEEFTVSAGKSKYPDLNPYLGKRMHGPIHAVYVRGRLAYADGLTYQVGRTCLRGEFSS